MIWFEFYYFGKFIEAMQGISPKDALEKAIAKVNDSNLPDADATIEISKLKASDISLSSSKLNNTTEMIQYLAGQLTKLCNTGDYMSQWCDKADAKEQWHELRTETFILIRDIEIKP